MMQQLTKVNKMVSRLTGMMMLLRLLFISSGRSWVLPISDLVTRWSTQLDFSMSFRGETYHIVRFYWTMLTLWLLTLLTKLKVESANLFEWIFKNEF